MSSLFRSVARVALPVAAAFIPGIGPLAAAGLGAAGGALGGGGLRGAILGGITGGAGNYLGAGNLLGSAAGSSLAKTTGNALMQGPTQGSGILGAITRGVSGLGSGATSGISNLSGVIRPASSIISGMRQSSDQDEMEKQLLAAQGRAEQAFQPYAQTGLQAQRTLAGNLQEGFDPGDLTQDEGYQFRLGQGQEALNRQLAAGGLLGSGAAIKAGQEYGQGLASQQYNDAYNQWLQKNQQLAGVGSTGYNATANQANIYGNMGDVRANATLGRGNIFTNTLADVVGRTVIGYDEETGEPIYR